MNTNYAGFWLRFVAVLIDGLVLGVIQWIAVMPFLGLLGLGVASDIQNLENMDESEAMGMMGPMMAMAGVAYVGFFIIQILYYALMESSSKQATLGKMALGLKVTDINGNKIDFTKGLVRSLCRVISGMIMCIGYLIAAFTEKKQGLHDMIANTLVLKK
jgi:uncharacterized RDD family membrane protein YckC